MPERPAVAAPPPEGRELRGRLHGPSPPESPTSACLPCLPACLACLPALPACLPASLPACLPCLALPACLALLACLPVRPHSERRRRPARAQGIFKQQGLGGLYNGIIPQLSQGVLGSAIMMVRPPPTPPPWALWLHRAAPARCRQRLRAHAAPVATHARADDQGATVGADPGRDVRALHAQARLSPTCGMASLLPAGAQRACARAAAGGRGGGSWWCLKKATRCDAQRFVEKKGCDGVVCAGLLNRTRLDNDTQ
eukprot:SAG11_NODE_2613_length_3172_cov_2.450700_1_plen_255_part_00